jgi:hypothetical protein
MAGETAQQKLSLVEGDKSIDVDPEPGMMLVSCAAAELIPTIQYGNVTIGPVSVKRWVPIGFKGFTEDEIVSIKLAVRGIQSICEEAVAEDRETVHALTRQSQQGRI